MRIQVKNMSHFYGEFCALQELDLEFNPGIYALLGPNGSGKSTFFNILVGNLKQTSGQVLCDGQDIRKLDDKYRELLGYMPQQQLLYDSFSGRRFLAYIATLKGIPKSEMKRAINLALERVNLTEDAGRKIGEYSGGMKQRILLAQAILAEPKIIILDEPTAGLDPMERIRVKNLIAALAQDRIVIIATHVVSDVDQIANQIVLLKEGNILANETPKILQEKLEQYIFEITIPLTDFEQFRNTYPDILLGAIRNEEENLILRIIVKDLTKPIKSYSLKPVIPNLADVYLYYMGDQATVFPQFLTM